MDVLLLHTDEAGDSGGAPGLKRPPKIPPSSPVPGWLSSLLPARATNLKDYPDVTGLSNVMFKVGVDLSGLCGDLS